MTKADLIKFLEPFMDEIEIVTSLPPYTYVLVPSYGQDKHGYGQVQLIPISAEVKE